MVKRDEEEQEGRKKKNFGNCKIVRRLVMVYENYQANPQPHLKQCYQYLYNLKHRLF